MRTRTGAKILYVLLSAPIAICILYSSPVLSRLNKVENANTMHEITKSVPGCSEVVNIRAGSKLVRWPNKDPVTYVDTPDGKRCDFLSKVCSERLPIDGILWDGNELESSRESFPKRNSANSEQVWFAYASETHAPPYWLRHVGDPEWMKEMNYAQHYGTNADFPADSIPGMASWPKTDPKILEDKIHWILYLSSNCAAQSERDDFVRRASYFMDISSLGVCAHNTDFPPRLKHLEMDSDGNSLRLTWKDYGKGHRAVLADYRFRLVIISTLCDDYWADGEKVYQTLEAGVIPIYLGMPNSHDWDPGIAAGVHPAMIHVQDFEGMQELADFIRDLGGDSEEALKRRRRYREFEGLSPVQYPRHAQQLLNKTKGMNWNQFVCEHTHNGDSRRHIEPQLPCRGSWWQYLESLGKDLSRWGCTESDPCITDAAYL